MKTQIIESLECSTCNHALVEFDAHHCDECGAPICFSCYKWNDGLCKECEEERADGWSTYQELNDWVNANK